MFFYLCYYLVFCGLKYLSVLIIIGGSSVLMKSIVVMVINIVGGECDFKY